MTSPFQQIAPQYAALWSDTPRGRSQREQVWRVIDDLFHPGDRILDLGCGTGDDAVHLASRGVSVLGIDTAPGMVEIARTRGVNANQMAIEDIGLLDAHFDGAISNFGALNCVANLDQLSEALAQLVRPQGTLALGVMSRYSWSDWRHALPRWSGHTIWRGIHVYYRSARSISRAFSPHFEFQRRVSIGYGDHQLLIFKRRSEC
ncbi:MAG: Methyltransferase type 11 [Bryobacterales bacterium]|nr:Methyltransferase type 11 [Bryobacterales bacterium]